MNSIFSILLKNAILLILLIISLIFIFTNNIGYKQVSYLFIFFGILYIVAACFEAYKLSQINKTVKKYTYFTDGFLAKRFLKIIAFVCCGVVLLVSNSIIKYLAFLCFTIAVAEIAVNLWRYYKNLCFVAFDGATFILTTNKLTTIWANDIFKIETRHGLTYFVNSQQIAFQIRTDMMKEKDAFLIELKQWIAANNLESKVSIN